MNIQMIQNNRPGTMVQNSSQPMLGAGPSMSAQPRTGPGGPSMGGPPRPGGGGPSKPMLPGAFM